MLVYLNDIDNNELTTTHLHDRLHPIASKIPNHLDIWQIVEGKSQTVAQLLIE